jgi:hypothetical protein
MLKTFTLWVEDQNFKNSLTRTFLDKLGYEPNTLRVSPDVIMTGKKLSGIVDAINTMGDISDDNKQTMINYAKEHHKNLSLKALADLINPDSAERQDTASSTRAIIPQANQPAPKPMNPQQQMQQQQNQPPMAAGPGGF